MCYKQKCKVVSLNLAHPVYLRLINQKQAHSPLSKRMVGAFVSRKLRLSYDYNSYRLHYKQESCAIAKMTAWCALYKWIEWAVVEIWSFGIIPDGGLTAAELGFDVTGNSAIRSADPENPTLEPNMKCIGSPVAEIWPFTYLGGIWNPHLGGEVVWVSDGTIRKSDGGFLCSPLWRCAICNHSAAICDRMSPTLKSTGGGSLWAQISGCSPWSRPPMFGSTESKHPRLTTSEIIFEEFQPMWSQSTNVTDEQTDRQTTCDRKTALCTKVHRAVKKQTENILY